MLPEAGPGRLPGVLPSHHRSSCFLHSSLLQRRESRGLPTPGRAPGPIGRGRAASTLSRQAGSWLSDLGRPPSPAPPPSSEAQESWWPPRWSWVLQFSEISSVTLRPHGLREVSSVSHDRGVAVLVRGFPLDPGHHPCWGWPTRRPGCPAQGWTLPPQPSPL